MTATGRAGPRGGALRTRRPWPRRSSGRRSGRRARGPGPTSGRSRRCRVDEHEPVELRRDRVDRVDGAGVEALLGGEDLGLGAEDVVPGRGLVVHVVRQVRGCAPVRGAGRPAGAGRGCSNRARPARSTSPGCRGSGCCPRRARRLRRSGRTRSTARWWSWSCRRALAVHDDDGAGAGPVLAHRAHPPALEAFRLGGGDADPHACEEAADALRRRLLDFLTGEERLPCCAAGRRGVVLDVGGRRRGRGSGGSVRERRRRVLRRRRGRRDGLDGGAAIAALWSRSVSGSVTPFGFTASSCVPYGRGW